MKVYEEKILVMMVGDEKPTFLDMTLYVKVSSLGDDIQMIANKKKIENW